MATQRHVTFESDEGTSQTQVPKLNDDDHDDHKVHLKRQIGLFTATCLVIGNIIGVGIFISPKGVLRQTQSVGMCLVVWSLCGLISLLGALCYTELGTMIPKSGGEYVFFYTAFGSAPAFLFSWVTNLILRPASLAIVCISFADYAVAPFLEGSGNACDPPDNAMKLIAITCLFFLAMINCFSVKLSTNFVNFFTISKLIALAIIIVVGIVRIAQGYTEHLDPKTSFDDSATDLFAYGVAFYQGLFPYDGWNGLTYITEELINPYRNLPLAILIGVPIVTVVYILTNIAYFTVLSPAELLQSDAVAVTFSIRTLGPVSWIIPLGVILSIFGVITTGLIFSARLPYVAAREGHMPQILAMIHVRRYTPVPALVFLVSLVTIMILPGTIDTLLNYFSFVNWLVYGSSFIALLWLRYKHPEWERPIKVPLIVPILMVIASLYLIAAPIIDNPSLEYLFAALFVLAGLIVYFPLAYYKYRPPFMDRLTLCLQLFFYVAPSGYNT
ncbi:b(0,+)-type amino acid transporter 1-like [Amphiura filiformis]|uniref:b(0,+)-type amino acid transporter 1-like n=1 Tax=Amphiura filiformis TaxID=82378 RepID=UPI003B219C0B